MFLAINNNWLTPLHACGPWSGCVAQVWAFDSQLHYTLPAERIQLVKHKEIFCSFIYKTQKINADQIQNSKAQLIEQSSMIQIFQIINLWSALSGSKPSAIRFFILLTYVECWAMSVAMIRSSTSSYISALGKEMVLVKHKEIFCS